MDGESLTIEQMAAHLLLQGWMIAREARSDPDEPFWAAMAKPNLAQVWMAGDGWGVQSRPADDEDTDYHFYRVRQCDPEDVPEEWFRATFDKTQEIENGRL